MQICHEKRRFTLPKRLPPISCAREPLRACSCSCAPAPARLLLGASAACPALGAGLLRASPWDPSAAPLGGPLRAAPLGGPLRTPPPGESPSARRRLGISSSARRLEGTGEDKGLTG